MPVFSLIMKVLRKKSRVKLKGRVTSVGKMVDENLNFFKIYSGTQTHDTLNKTIYSNNINPVLYSGGPRFKSWPGDWLF
jgi:hypothetical protein